MSSKFTLVHFRKTSRVVWVEGSVLSPSSPPSFLPSFIIFFLLTRSFFLVSCVVSHSQIYDCVSYFSISSSESAWRLLAVYFGRWLTQLWRVKTKLTTLPGMFKIQTAFYNKKTLTVLVSDWLPAVIIKSTDTRSWREPSRSTNSLETVCARWPGAGNLEKVCQRLITLQHAQMIERTTGYWNDTCI